MPIYEYKCDKCENVKKVMQHMTDKQLTNCDECGGPIKKLVSSPKKPHSNDINVKKDNIRKDTQRIREEIHAGNSNTIDDVLGSA